MKNEDVTPSFFMIGDDLADPYHGKLVPGEGHNVKWGFGVHQAVGGLHDAPVPGDILCAALAACQESAIRMVANLLGITLTSEEGLWNTITCFSK